MKYDCFQKALSSLFKTVGKTVARHKLKIIIISIIVAVSLSSGIIFFSFQYEIEYLFTPIWSKAIDDREIVRELFPVNYSKYSNSRTIEPFERQVVLIVTSKEEGNILQHHYLDEIVNLDKRLKEIKIAHGNGTDYDYQTLCGMWNGRCIENHVLSWYRLLTVSNESFTFPYPVAVYSVDTVFVFEALLGGVIVSSNNTVESAEALQLRYPLRHTPSYYNNISGVWEDKIKDFISTYKSELVKIDVFISDALDEAQRELTLSVVPLFSITYTILITFAIWSCVMFDNVLSKPWLGSMGVISASLAVASTLGLLSYLGVPFNQVTTSVPFLILGIGLDDMFIMLAAWRQTNPRDSVEDRMGDTYSSAAVSISITSVTDCLAFFIGSITPLRSIRVFCMYAGVAVLLDFLFQITFFGACLAVFGHREHSNRHSMTCLVVRPKDENNTKIYNACCAGGILRFDSGNYDDSTHFFTKFFGQHFAKTITYPKITFIIIIVYFAFLGSSVYGITRTEQNLQLKNLAETNSVTYDYYTQYSRYFNKIGQSVSMIINGSVSYWDERVQARIEEMATDCEKNNLIIGKNYTSFWLRDFKTFFQRGGSNINNNKTMFYNNLEIFLKQPQYEIYELDLTFQNREIYSSRFVLVSAGVEHSKQEVELMDSMRKVATDYSEPVKGEIFGTNFTITAYSPGFIFTEQYVILLPYTALTVGTAMLSMLVVAALFIPNIVVAIIVAFSVISIVLGVVSYMTFWGVSLDAISMINIVLCIGFSVDFSAHISYAFVSARGSSRERVSEALALLGYPILQSGVSTVLAVSMLFFANSYVFEVFAKVLLLVMVFGILHALFCIPTILYVLSSCYKYISKGRADKNINQDVTLKDKSHDNQAFG